MPGPRRGGPTEAASAAGNGKTHESPGNGSVPPAGPGPSAGGGEGGEGPQELVIECGGPPAAPAAAIVDVLPPEEFEPEFAEAYR